MLLLSVSCVAVAQSFKQGSVRLKGGEERPGFIGKIRQGSPEGVEFRAGNDTDVQVYFADEIEGYAVDSIFYSSYHSNVYREKEWVFAEILAEGDLTLIRRNNMYFVRETGQVEFTHLSAYYKLILSRLTKSCPIVSVKTGRLHGDKKELAAFIKEYNDCVASKKPNLAGMPRTLSFGVQVGCDNTLPEFTANRSPELYSAAKPSDRSFFQGGLEVSFKHYKVSRFLSLYTGVILNVNSYSVTSRVPDKNGSTVFEYSYSYTELRMPLGIEISRPTTKKLTFHVRGGVVFPRVLSLKPGYFSTEQSDKSGSTVTYGQSPSLATYKPGMMVGGAIGFDYKIAASRVRIQAGYYAGKLTATATTADLVGSPATTSIAGKLTSFSVMTTYIF